MKNSSFVATLAAGVCVVALATPASAQTTEYRIPAGSLKSALDAFARQSGRQIIYKADEIRRARSPGVQGARTAESALATLLEGSGFSFRADSSGAIAIIAGEADAGAPRQTKIVLILSLLERTFADSRQKAPSSNVPKEGYSSIRILYN